VVSAGSAVAVFPAHARVRNVVIRTKSSPATVIVSNTGNFALMISRVSNSGTNKGDFHDHGRNCHKSTLAPGASCQVTIVFGPSSTGAESATLAVATTAPGSPQSALLTGTGVSKK